MFPDEQHIETHGATWFEETGYIYSSYFAKRAW